jgi:hypothetical protein
LAAIAAVGETAVMSDLRSIQRQLFPPALDLLISHYCDDARGWNRGHHRQRAAEEIVVMAIDSGSLEDLQRKLLGARKVGPLVEVWHALRSAIQRGVLIEGDPMTTIRTLLRDHRTDA